MKLMNSIKAFAITIALLGFSNFTLASTMLSCSHATSKGAQDYGDAPSSYGSACNKTDNWQKLGTQWDTDSINQATDADNSTDDGVSWKTSSDGGATWTSYSTTGKLTRGDLVQFKFEMTRSTSGDHKYDQLKSWVDWNGNGSWANDTSETIIKKNWWKNENSEGVADGGGTKNGDLSNWYHNNWKYLPDSELDGWNKDKYKRKRIYNSNDTTAVFYQQMTIPLDAAVGDTWLRARVVCENSLSNSSYNLNYNMLPNGYQDQGETEDYQLTIAAKAAKPAVDVPEPSTMFLFMIGAIAAFSKRRNFLGK